MTEERKALRELYNAKRNRDEAHAVLIAHPGDLAKSKLYHQANVRWRKIVKYCITHGERLAKGE
jgi:hypothetical protein